MNLTSDTIRELLKASGLSMSELARRSGVPFTTVQSIVNTSSEIRVDNAVKLARAVGYDVRLVKVKTK